METMRTLRRFSPYCPVAAAAFALLLLCGTVWAGASRIPYRTIENRVITDPDVMAVYAPGDVVLITNPEDLINFYLFVRPGQEPPTVDFTANAVVAVFGFSRPNHNLYLSHLTRGSGTQAVVHLIDISGGAPLDPKFTFDNFTLEIVVTEEIISDIEAVVVREIFAP